MAGTPPPPRAPAPPPLPQGQSAGWIFKTLFFLSVAGTLLVALVGGLIYWEVARDLPQIITAQDYRPQIVTQLIAVGPPSHPAAKPVVVAEFKKERRYVLPYEKIPDRVIHAFVAAEDDKFFEHSGINIAGMIRAALANLRAGHTVQGGSTITQQVTKSLILSPERTFSRKIKEIILAERLEHNLSKQQILFLYLNEIYLGHGAYGVEAASETYFRKPVSELTLAEAAILAGMPQAPGKYSPLLNPKRAKERQTYVLRRMRDVGYITDAQMKQAVGEPIRVYEEEDINDKYAPYLVEYIRKYLLDKYGEKALYEDGLTVTLPTTADVLLSAKKNLRAGLETVDKRSGYRGPIKRLNAGEVDAYLEGLRAELIQRKLESQLLTPDGTLDPVGVMKAAGYTSDAQLLDADELYPAVVTQVNDGRRPGGASCGSGSCFAVVKIGRVKAVLPFDQMRWARPVRDSSTNPPTLGPEPRMPSGVVHPGDVILVKLLSDKDGEITVTLEQEPQVQGALLSIEAQTGYVLALAGGYDYEKSEFNRATQALRQPGSSFKPILYSAALERGFTPASIIVDSPIVYSDADGKWKPSNFEERFIGDTTFRQALIHSMNVPTVKILQRIQVPYFLDYAKRLGITTPLPADLSISLGSASLSLLELTKTYSLFPRLGRKVDPIFFMKVTDRDGKTLEENVPKPMPATPRIAPMPAPVAGAPKTDQPFALPSYPPADDPDQVMDPRVAYVMTHLMKEVVTFGTGQGAQQLGRPSAGKTGTTSDYVDAWYMGFTPQVVTGTWVGYDNHRTIGTPETGGRAALPIWVGFMKDVTRAYPESDFAVPPGIVFASIDQKTGKLAPPSALHAIKEAFIEGTEPTEQADDNSPQDSPSGSGDFFKDDLE